MRTYTRPVAISVDYDSEARAWYVRLADTPIGRTVRENDCVLLDLDEGGRVVGIEVLDIDALDIDACAAKYGFADRAGAIGIALGMAVPA